MPADTSLEEVKNRLRPIVAKTLSIPEEELLDEFPLFDFGLSSVTFLVLLLKINKYFKIRLDLAELSLDHSLNSLAPVVFQKLSQQSIDVHE